MTLDLKELCARIDGIDAQLVELLRSRLNTAAQIAAWKAEHGTEVSQMCPEQDYLERIAADAGETCGSYVTEIFRKILEQTGKYENRMSDPADRNIMLIGMPGCGKTTIGNALSQKTGRPLVDLDEQIVLTDGRPIPEIFASEGEEFFRQLEHKVLCRWAQKSGYVISCGGGIVTRPENMAPLQWNSTVVFLLRDLDRLPIDGRPVSQANRLSDLFERRYPLYCEAADITVDNNSDVSETVSRILEKLEKTE